ANCRLAIARLAIVDYRAFIDAAQSAGGGRTIDNVAMDNVALDNVPIGNRAIGNRAIANRPIANASIGTRHSAIRQSAVCNRQSAMSSVPVQSILRDLAQTRGIALELVAGGGGVERRITNPYPQKTGLALSAFDQYPREGRVLVLGESEIRFLESLTAAERIDVVRRVFSHDIPCLVVTAGLDPPPELAAEADRATLPLLRSRAATPIVMARLSAALDVYLAARGVVHGVLMDILGLGVLIVGDSGIGKSEGGPDVVVR